MARSLTPPQMVKALGLLADTKEGRKENRKTYRRVSKVAVGLSRVEMRKGPRQLASVAGKIRATSNADQARIAVPGGRASAAVRGTRGPTGWLGNERHRGTQARNNPQWIGNNWRVATKGEGPYGINDALDGGSEKIVAEFERALTDRMDRAFRGR